METPSGRSTFLSWFDPRLTLVVYVRLLAIVFLVAGLQRWGVMLGPLAPGGDFLAMPTPLVVATVFFAVFELVACVGLWLLASWGTVVWLIAALTETILHVGFTQNFGRDDRLVAFHLVSVLVYVIFTFLYERSRTD